MTPRRQSDPVRSLDDIRPTQVKAGLVSDRAGQPSDHLGPAPSAYLSVVIRDALLRHYGSVKAMAYHLGQVDPSLMNREFEAGKLGRVDQYADELAKAAIAVAMVDAFSELSTPEARMRQLFREIREKLNEAEQYAESRIAG